MTSTEEWLAHRQAVITDLPEADREFPWGVSYYGSGGDLPEGCEVYIGQGRALDMDTALPLATSIVDTHNNAPKAYSALEDLLEQHSAFEWSYSTGRVQHSGVACLECLKQTSDEQIAEYPCTVRRTIEEHLA